MCLLRGGLLPGGAWLGGVPGLGGLLLVEVSAPGESAPGGGAWSGGVCLVWGGVCSRGDPSMH